MNKNYLILVLGFLLLASCRDKELDMTVMHQTLFEGSAIQAITAEDAWNVTVVQDDEQSFVDVEYSAFLNDYLKITLSGQELGIGFTNRLNLPSGTTMNVTVHAASVQNLHFSEAVNVVLDGTFQQTSLTMELEDAATCKGGHFDGKAEVRLTGASTLVDCYFLGQSCHIELEDASVFKGWFNNDTLNVKLSDASRMTTYGGYVKQANVVVDGASMLNTLQTYVSENMYIVVKNASEASVAVWRPATMEGFVVDASALYYQGNPIMDVGCDATSTIQPL